MRTLLLAGAMTLALGGTAFAQMCGGAQHTTAQSGGMSCMGGMKQAEDDPMADKPAAKPMMGAMMCACCRNMASMGGMKHETPHSEPKHETPMPKH
jgi:hypothetical protein